MYELALFAGAGGGVLGGRLLGWETVGAVEFDGYCREVLLRRQDEGILGPFPIWDDVGTFRRGNPDVDGFLDALGGFRPLVVTAGFPCQPYSSTGKRLGEKDERNLWPDTVRIVGEVGPDFVLLENVARLLRYDYFGIVLADLDAAGYDAEWEIVSAGDVGAPHLRKRVWVFAHRRMAHAEGLGREVPVGKRGRDGGERIQGDAVVRREVGKRTCRETEMADARGRSRAGKGGPEAGGHGGPVGGEDSEVLAGWWDDDPADADGVHGGLRKSVSGIEPRDDQGDPGGLSVDDRWGIEPGLGRVADGVADRLDRLRAIGNGQVPLVAAFAVVALAKRAGIDPRVVAPALYGS